jgi:hypothetical protein
MSHCTAWSRQDQTGSPTDHLCRAWWFCLLAVCRRCCPASKAMMQPLRAHTLITPAAWVCRYCRSSYAAAPVLCRREPCSCCRPCQMQACWAEDTTGPTEASGCMQLHGSAGNRQGSCRLRDMHRNDWHLVCLKWLGRLCNTA